MLTPLRPISPPQGAGMVYVVAALIALFGGWWVAATDALFRASERPGMFAGTSGMVLLLIATAGGGLLLAGGAIWIAQIAGSGSVAVIIGIFGFLGAKGSNMLHATAAGAVNRMLVGLLGLTILYGIAWTVFPAS
jgi:hypothetical protein